jgi:hypothetical protein
MYTYMCMLTHMYIFIYIGLPAEENAVDILQILYEDYDILKILLLNCLGLVPVSDMEVIIYVYTYIYINIYIYIYIYINIHI